MSLKFDLIFANNASPEAASYSWSSRGADPGFLEMGFKCIKGWGFALLILSHFSSISHENEIIWSH